MNPNGCTPPPRASEAVLGGAISRRGALAACVVVVIVVLAGWFAMRYWKKHHREGLAYPPFVDALGHVTPVPGDPDRNILRRSEPYPPGRYPYGGLGSYYFQTDPAYSGYEDDYCIHAPAACAAMGLTAFRPNRR